MTPTASASLSIPACKADLQSSSNNISFASALTVRREILLAEPPLIPTVILLRSGRPPRRRSILLCKNSVLPYKTQTDATRKEKAKIVKKTVNTCKKDRLTIILRDKPFLYDISFWEKQAFLTISFKAVINHLWEINHPSSTTCEYQAFPT